MVASANPAKAAEIARLLVGVDVRPGPTGLGPVEEDAADLDGNARLKATAVGEATGMSALADDSGLEVDHLGGGPGVRSARFAADEGAGDPGDDAANRAALLRAMAGVEDRRARFRSVVVLRRADGSEVVAEGTVEGVVLATTRGSGGFGYDPLFVPDDGDGRTFAEMTADDKAALSHRGRALAALARRLDEQP